MLSGVSPRARSRSQRTPVDGGRIRCNLLDVGDEAQPDGFRMQRDHPGSRRSLKPPSATVLRILALDEAHRPYPGVLHQVAATQVSELLEPRTVEQRQQRQPELGVPDDGRPGLAAEFRVAVAALQTGDENRATRSSEVHASRCSRAPTSRWNRWFSTSSARCPTDRCPSSTANWRSCDRTDVCRLTVAWLGDVDSNHDKQSQSLLSYR